MGVSPLQRVRAVFLYAGHQFASSLTFPLIEAICLNMEQAEWASEMKNGDEIVGERLETSVDAFAVSLRVSDIATHLHQLPSEACTAYEMHIFIVSHVGS